MIDNSDRKLETGLISSLSSRLATAKVQISLLDKKLKSF
jgi:hypothetical protein